MKVWDTAYIIIFIFIIFLGFSRRGEVFRRVVPARRLFILAAVASSAIGAILVIVSAAKGASAGEMLGLFGISIGVGLGVAVVVYYCFYLLPQLYRNFKFKYLRSTLIYGMILAFLFTIWAFFVNREEVLMFAALYVLGIFFGLLSGRIFIGYTRDRIIDGKYIIPWPREWDFRKYWKSYVIVALIMAMMFLLPNIIFRSAEIGFSAFTGLFLGMMLYTLIWVIMYEQQNHVRLKNEIREQFP